MSHFTPFQQAGIATWFQMPEIDTALSASSTKYCPECFRIDICNHLAPIWRKSWRIRGSAICVNHTRPVLLSSLIMYANDATARGWQGYKEHFESPASRLLTSFPIVSAPSNVLVANNARLLLLVRRVQVWYQALFHLDSNSAQSFDAMQFLMGVWLHQAELPRLSSGIARTFFQSASGRKTADRSVRSITAPEASIDTATPRELAVAYWLLGVSYGVISYEDARFVRDVTRPTFAPFPVTMLQIAGATTQNYLDEGLSFLIDEGVNLLTLEGFREVSWVFVRLLRSKDF
jgi:hypothetical protein